MFVDLRQLRHFIALVECRNFTQAAQSSNISQSAFSRSIQALEQSVGARLIDRNRNLEPTRKGLVVLEHARRLIGNAQELVNDVSQFNEREEVEMRFACGPAPAAWLMPQAVGLFTQRLPKVRLHFQVDNWQALGQRLLSDDFEFIIADSRYFEFNPDYQVQNLSQHRWAFCCRSGHPLAAQERVTVEQMLRYPIAGTVRPPNLRKALVELSGRPDFKTGIECENGYSLVPVVLNSDAIGTTSASPCNPHLADGSLVLLDVEGLDQQAEEFFTHYGIISRAGFRLSYAAQTLMECFLEADRELQARDRQAREV
ncbi:LysR family transcriptional regulator [Pseudomonas sp. LRF_L74]|uniref:LysR family transcriptional regulator n=1 Tax=Pseudomonas sp. LRF_L74 TaxID=3369422 RepID=UPI003F5EC724